MAFDGEMAKAKGRFPQRGTNNYTTDEENAGHMVIGAISVIN